jgi:hypothetical protein
MQNNFLIEGLVCNLQLATSLAAKFSGLFSFSNYIVNMLKRRLLEIATTDSGRTSDIDEKIK